MLGENLTYLLASTALMVALTALGLVAVHLAGRRTLAWTQSLKHVREVRQQQMVTVIHVVQWLLIVLLVGSAVLMLLGTFGIDITPLLASVGVAGLAISLGAQSLIKDLIGGVLIIVENQYAVGDSIVLGSVSGEVRILANQTKGWSRAVVEVGVAYEEDLERALGVLRASTEAFAQDPAFGESLLEPPQVL